MTDAVTCHAIECEGETLELLGGRAIHWAAQRTLFVADTHFGKPAAFRAAGVPVPELTTGADLDRLTALITRASAERLIILGDVVHAPQGQTQHTIEAIADWRSTWRSLDVAYITGNHDRRVEPFPTEWRMTRLNPGTRLGPFTLHHDPTDDPDGYTLSGHIHPMIRLRDGVGAGVRCPCFLFEARHAILPAFGGFVGLARVKPTPDARVFLIGPDQQVYPFTIPSHA